MQLHQHASLLGGLKAGPDVGQIQTPGQQKLTVGVSHVKSSDQGVGLELLSQHVQALQPFALAAGRQHGVERELSQGGLHGLQQAQRPLVGEGPHVLCGARSRVEQGTACPDPSEPHHHHCHHQHGQHHHAGHGDAH